MKSFNKIFKQILLQNELFLNQENNTFPTAFSFADYGLDFIFDIMPTFNQQYVWHTVEDLQNIPELVNTLKNTDQNILNEIAYGFQQIANNQQEQYPNEMLSQLQTFRKIAAWIKTIKTENTSEQITENEDELNIHDKECFNTVPNVVKEVRPRSYRRGLKALSLANRTKFNKEHISIPKDEIQVSHTDKVNKVKEQTNIQQPISKSVIVPAPGVNRPLGLNRSQKKQKHNFANMVYQPSITQITKQNAKKRCLLARKNKAICSQQKTDLQFTTNYAQEPKPIKKPQPVINAQIPNKKQLCIICKTYVQPKQVKLKNGKTIYQCPKCGLRMQNSNY